MGIIKSVWDLFDGKKTAIGATSFLFWVFIYALPAFHPEYSWVTQYGTQIRDFLMAHGIVLDDAAFNTGTFASILGLLDKFRKAKKDSE